MSCRRTQALRNRVLTFAALAVLMSTAAHAGGAWVMPRGDANLSFGWSRKTATTSWDAFGDTLDHDGHAHDFRYNYLSGEVGLHERISGTFLVTWLDGREGRPGAVETNRGFSDAWLGLKYSLRRGRTPLALALNVRTALLYDLDGPYSRHLHDDEGRFVEESPEWRGLLKEDAALIFLASRSLRRGRGWTSAEIGYNWRNGAPADEVPVAAELGWKLPWRDIAIKGSTLWVFSLDNNSRPRDDDRFRGRPEYDFNRASMGRVGLSAMLPLGAAGRYRLEAGYHRWIWGESARQYSEPFVSLGYRF